MIILTVVTTINLQCAAVGFNKTLLCRYVEYLQSHRYDLQILPQPPAAHDQTPCSAMRGRVRPTPAQPLFKSPESVAAIHRHTALQLAFAFNAITKSKFLIVISKHAIYLVDIGCAEILIVIDA